MGVTWAKLGRQGLAVQAGLLTLAATVLCVLVLPVAALLSGAAGLAAAATAAAVCLAGGLLALAMGHRLRDPRYAMHAMLLGMLVRMGVPLCFALVCYFFGGALAEAGAIYYLLIFYPVMLAVDVALVLPRLRSAEKPRRSGQMMS